MKQFSTGWRLTKQSWAVLSADASLAVYPVLAFLSSAAALGVFVIAGGASTAATGQDWPLVIGALTGSWVATFFTVYFNVALAGAAAMSMRGRNTSLRDGLEVAHGRLGVIARWSVVQWAVGVVLEVLRTVLTDEDSPAGRVVGRLVGALISNVVGAAWSIATFFVVPVLALEGAEPKDAMHRSLGLIRKNWGAGFVGNSAIGLVVMLLGGVPAVLLMWIGVTDPTPTVGYGEVGLGAVLLVATAIVASALNVIFRVALYRYAAEGQFTPAFATGDLLGAFRAPRTS